tara:strand:- start:3716 stop:4339 length:624 start_codon:yes stop_codon:yes gene_type:complete
MPYIGKEPNASPSQTLGTGAAEDILLKLDGNAVDYHIGLDDSADKLTIGKGSALGTTTSMTFDENGIINKPLQPATFCHLSGNQSIASGSWVKAAMASEDYDQNNDMDLSNYKFVAPVDGLYFVTLTGGFHMDTDKYIGVAIYVNGAEGLRACQVTGITNHHQCTTTGVLKLDADDYIEWYFLHIFGSDDNITGSKEYTHAMVHLLA